MALEGNMGSGGNGQVVSILYFYSDNPSLNPAEGYNRELRAVVVVVSIRYFYSDDPSLNQAEVYNRQ